MDTRTFSGIVVVLLIFFSNICGHSEENKLLQKPLPQEWEYLSDFSQTLPNEDSWWRNFNDKCLDSLINIAITNNYNLQIAIKRIALAKSAIKIAQSGYYPNISINASWTKERSSGSTDDFYDLGLNFNWQIDLFGQISSQAKVKKALWQATKSQYDGVMITLCANVATAYINLRTSQTQYVVANTHLLSQKQILEMTEARYKSGLASMLDVSQAKTVYLSTLASIKPLMASIETQINSIAILLGIYSNELPQSINNFTELPEINALVPMGVPADLLRRRPDIKEAEYTVASYAASIGIAKKDFLPTLSLNGGIGFKSSKVGDLFDKNAFNYSISPTLTWTIFDGLSRKYQLIEAKEEYMIGIDNYNNTVMTAVKEVQNAIVNYKYNLQESNDLEKVTSEALNSLKLSVDLYKRGLSDFTNVLTSQQSYLQYNNSLITTKGKTLLSLISIYQALGGGWQNNSNY